MSDQDQLRAAIEAQESLRGTVDDAIVDVAVAALRQRLSAVAGTGSAKRRRLVTVLFADVSGSTALGERLHVEELSDRFDRLWDAVDAVIERHGGRIDKHIGDGVMALWGTEVSADDDAERAIRAALEMQRTVVESGSDIGTDGLQLRIGINTGPVVLGAIASTDEINVMGDTVNVAARLEAAAPVGSVLAGHDTYRHVRGVFTVSEQEPLLVKGKRDALRTYVIEGVRQRAFHLPGRDIEGVEARMVGRDDEFTRLTDALQRTVESSQAQLVAITGEAGTGKSRLAFEFEDWLRIRSGDVRLFNGRSTRERAQVPYALLRDLLFERFEITDDEPAEVALARITVGLRSLNGDLDAADARVVAHLVGLGAGLPTIDATELADRGAEVIGRLLVGAAADMPVVVMLEDLHWADRSSLELARRAFGVARSSPVVVVAVSRPTDPPIGEILGSVFDSIDTIEVPPLTDEATEDLVHEILQRVESVPVTLTDEIVRAASGHPYFVEELIRMLIDDGAVVVDGDEWRIDPEPIELRAIPTTVSGVAQARLDLLDPAARAVVQRAAVVGRVFWDAAIPRSSCGVGPAPADPTSSLSELVARGLVEKAPGSDLRSADEYRFAHALLHDAVYDTLLRDDRRSLHREVAEWLADRRDPEAFASMVADQYLAGDAPADAAAWFARAANEARARHAPDEAIQACEAAIDTGALDPPALLAVLDDLSESLLIAARYDDALRSTNEMYRLAVDLGDGHHRSIALLQQSHLHLRLGSPRRALDAAEAAVEHARRPDAGPGEEVQAATEVAWILLRLGRAREAIEQGRSLLDSVDPTESRQAVRNLHGAVGAAHNVLGEYGAADEQFRAALALDRAQGDRRGEAADLINLGEAARLRGDPAGAVARFEAALSIVRDIGDRDQEALVLSNLGGALLEIGSFDEALVRLDEALHGFERSGNSEHVSETHRFLAEAQLALGRIDEAGRSAQQALDLARFDENPDHLGHAWRAVGLVGAAQSSHDGAPSPEVDPATCLVTAVDVFAEAEMERDRAIALRDLASFLSAQGDDDRAASTVREVREILERLQLGELLERIERRLADSGVVT